MKIKQAFIDLLPKLSIIRNFKREPYMVRLTLFNFFDLISCKAHLFLQSDDRGSEHQEPLNHSHPWEWFFTIILSKNGYMEITEKGRFHRKRFYIGGGNGDYLHRVELLNYPLDHPEYPGAPIPCFTLFFTGPKHGRSWGYKCHNKIVPFDKFDYDKGCD